ncbi:hypothetical protein [Weeksella virosa]|uniref:Secreted protein n=1 Tax=Weeksella virosa (strain ATCC 43766 / DSM 16922 / JCM 21250 / CCUG 30538 / CDC 9751 / IAM 14551 / NBRC 16016 / NCTC 11634 / CL345/78) TaxID=865938 RepID=F0P0E6_WEEVC|nr:hypothetical protein [Weeksella virosa]ADX67430.1 hypothetical protein Weevi_0715 [Weeksella virosa DSM 16922]VEH62828.1 Uncharacterised protein [Weeksella virosa]
MKKIAALLIILGISSVLLGQQKNPTTPYFLLQTGYTNWNGNYGKLGADLYLVQPNDNIIDLGLAGNLGYMQNNFILIPEASIGYLFNFYQKAADPYSKSFRSSFYTARINVSPWSISPELGFTVLSVFEFNAGYAIEFREYKDFKSLEGLRFGCTFHLPTQLFAN